MKIPIYRQTLLLCFLFVSRILSGQESYANTIQETTLVLEEKYLTGYTTAFDFSREDVRRGWWEYSRKFGNPINMRSYYKVKIPSDYTDGNVDLIIYAKTEASAKGVDFFVGVVEAAFENQVKALLIDFKKDFLIRKINSKIADQKAEAAKLSDSYQEAAFADEREMLLDKLQIAEKSIHALKIALKNIAGD